MTRTITLFLLFITALSAAQTTVKGVITDAYGEPIPGANIFIEKSYDGASTDQTGRFEFETAESGERQLVVRFIGYREARANITLSGADVTIAMALEEEASELEAVTISAGAFTASDESRRTIFKAIDIATTAGATADIAGALNTLPGTQKVGESGRLFVRGGDGSETRTFIDGMLVLDAYGPSAPNTPSRGRFLPFMFKGTSFSTGGYSAEYGQALSSALALDSRDESDAERTDIGLLSVGADVAHTRAWNGGSAAAKIQYTNLRPYIGLISQEIDWRTPPASLEGVTAFRQKIGRHGMAKVYGNFSSSDFSLYHHDINDYNLTSFYRLRNDYRYLNASYKTTLSDEWVLRSGVSWSSIRNNATVGSGGKDDLERGLHIKAVGEGSVTSWMELKTGGELIAREFTRNSAGITNEFAEWLPSVFAEADFLVSRRFMIRAGGRVERSSLHGNISADSRVSAAWKFDGASQMSFAYGSFRQTAANQFVLTTRDLDAEKAEHFILNYQHIVNNRTFRIEGYYKSYRDLVKFGNNSINNDGNGYAKGIELFWRDNRTVKGLDYWVSYSLLDTRRNYLHFPGSATPSFASKHNFSVVTKYFVSAWKSQLGATYSFASGRPYHDPNQDTFQGRQTPAYQDLSVNLSYLPRPNIIVHLSCTNITGYNNIFGYEFSQHPDAMGVYNGRAIRQPAPRFLFLGVFITLSKDKSISQLPTL